MKIFKLLFLSLAILFLASPVLAICPKGPDYFHGGLWDCIPTNPSAVRVCHLVLLLKNIVDFIIFTAMPILAVLYIAFAGFLYVISIENPANTKKFWDVMKGIFWGSIIIFGAWLFVSAFLWIIGVFTWQGFNTKGWWDFPCGSTTTGQTQTVPLPSDGGAAKGTATPATTSGSSGF